MPQTDHCVVLLCKPFRYGDAPQLCNFLSFGSECTCLTTKNLDIFSKIRTTQTRVSRNPHILLVCKSTSGSIYKHTRVGHTEHMHKDRFFQKKLQQKNRQNTSSQNIRFFRSILNEGPAADFIDSLYNVPPLFVPVPGRCALT